ncbi:MAG TPA: threonine dehydratase [Alphaproteobacteria bacterium]|nr:threonine dehydratase [Alphaproteobacteria bacterium]
MYDLSELEAAAALVHAAIPPTPQICWPLLSARAGAEVWVKHENHTPIGAFKLRGGLVYMAALKRREPGLAGVVTATRGNHGQSVGYAARSTGIPAVVVVPHGNSTEKNRAMRALGVELIEHGHDFQASYEHAVELAAARGLHLLRSYHPDLVRGVASYSLEFLRAVDGLDTVYVPIGLGSGASGMIAARDALGLKTKVVGVVAEAAPAYALSFAAGKPVSTNSADTIADGVACRVPDAAAVAFINRGAERIVAVSEVEIAAAMRHYFTDTHNLAEGAGAVPLAALLKERVLMAGKRIGLVLSGGNVDREVFAPIIAREGERAGEGGRP